MSIIRITVLSVFSLAALCAQPAIRGFSDEHARRQRNLEEKAMALPDPTRIGEYIRAMSAEPHHAGSAASRKVAEYAAGLLRDWGYDVEIEEFEALLPYPTKRVLEMTAPVEYRAKLKEPQVSEDPDSTDANQLPTYNAYSASGDITAPLVYVNYGLPEDYEQLRKLG
ncbi:MAG: folate hydrolase, partial [Bryobacteraceae bacterium]